MLKIDKSRFSPEDLANWERLVAKSLVDPKAPEGEEIPEEETEKCKTKKADEEDFEDAMKSANARLEALEKSIQMKEYTEVAKKYAALGENEEELAKTLYEMKKSSEALYNSYIGVLDKSMSMVEKSGVFSEIGKSGNAGGNFSGEFSKVDQIVSAIKKSDPTLSHQDAIAKAWIDHPELVEEYDKEY